MLTGTNGPFPAAMDHQKIWILLSETYCCNHPHFRPSFKTERCSSCPWLRCLDLRYSALKQAASLGLGDRWEKVKFAYAAANRALGDIVKARLSPG